jgi:hypothetical protein
VFEAEASGQLPGLGSVVILVGHRFERVTFFSFFMTMSEPLGRTQKVLRHLEPVGGRQKVGPIIWTARQDDVTRDRVFADKYFLRVKTKRSGQPNGLASSIDEQFGGL